jgi:hypothetical protein
MMILKSAAAARSKAITGASIMINHPWSNGNSANQRPVKNGPFYS